MTGLYRALAGPTKKSNSSKPRLKQSITSDLTTPTAADLSCIANHAMNDFKLEKAKAVTSSAKN